jgi:hypothetical protein
MFFRRRLKLTPRPIVPEISVGRYVHPSGRAVEVFKADDNVTIELQEWGNRSLRFGLDDAATRGLRDLLDKAVL